MKRLFIIVMLLFYIGCMASCGKEETNSDSSSATTTVSEINTETSKSVDTVKTETEKTVSISNDKPKNTEAPETASTETASSEVSGSGDYSIDGTWKIIRIDGSDGSHLEGDDLDSHEAYEISGDKGTYTAELMGKVKTWDITLEKTGDLRYIIKLQGEYKLCEAEFDGDIMFYTIDMVKVKETFTFERQK